ncbi:MAG TPA: hypothetical protein VF457_10140 [Burkholderiaceae bacterium]
MLAAEAAAIAASAAPMAADEAASLAAEAALMAAEAEVSAAEAASADDEAAAEAASAVGAVVDDVSAGLLQAVRAAATTREANRSDLFMNFLEEIWVRTITGNFGHLPSQQALLTKDARSSSSVSCA